jgi:hypothetical protein
MIAPEQARLIRRSFDAIWPFRRKFADLLYRRFFELAPDAERLFPGDLDSRRLTAEIVVPAPLAST